MTIDATILEAYPPPPEWWQECVRQSDLITSTIFPYFGGKSKIADLVWDRFGPVVNYVEPYAGSLAVMRARPHAPTIETLNDYSAHIANVWRSIKWKPDETAEWADWPVNEVDLHSRHAYLVKHEPELREKLLADPDYCDPKLAGWWIWGICAWIGSGWCTDYAATKNGRKQTMPALSHKVPALSRDGQGSQTKRMRTLSQQLPELGDGNGRPKRGRGVHSGAMRQRLPMLGAGSGGEDDHACARHGGGVHGKTLSQQLPSIGATGFGSDGSKGIAAPINRTRLYDVFAAISHRFRHTRITCGDAMRVLSDAITWRHGLTGVLLDPPYPGDAGSTSGIYTSAKAERETFNDAFRYCVENGGNKSLRIALCYYEGTKAPLEDGATVDVSEHLRLLGWDVVAWKAGGGYGGQSGTNKNASRERIAFSPHCLRAAQGSLFG